LAVGSAIRVEPVPVRAAYWHPTDDTDVHEE
jgi:hypothetical protein